MESRKPNVLFVDDEVTVLRSIIRGIQRRTPELECHAAVCESEALSMARKFDPEVIVVDLSLDPEVGAESGISLITKLFEINDNVRIIVLTGHDNQSWGMKAINAGATSFLSKPAEFDRLLSIINDGVHVSRLQRASKNSNKDSLNSIKGLGLTSRSEKMIKVMEELAFAASTNLPVLLCGETGVGKGIIAQAIHDAGKRKSEPFVRFQPTFSSYDLVNSELFGHVRGSFTGATDNRAGLIEQADKGTLFLDEVDSLPHQTQVALLHVLQEKEFQKIGGSRVQKSNFRLISATNHPTVGCSEKSTLRLDFFHRIAQHVIHIPSLRERRSDIPYLAEYFLERLSKNDPDGTVCKLSNEVATWLSAQPWPGNVRELQATIERGFAQAKFYQRRYLKVSDVQVSASKPIEVNGGSLSDQLKCMALTITSSALEKNMHNYSATARSLGIDIKRLKKILEGAEC